MFKNRNINKKDLLFSNHALLVLFLPLLIEQFLEFMVGFADSIMISSVGEAAISGVSLIDFIIQFLIFMFSALGTGGAVIAGQYLGRKNIDKASDASSQLVWFSGIMSIILMVLIYIFKYFIIGFLFGQIAHDVWVNANTYLMYVSFSIPFIALYNAAAAIFRTTGNSKLPMYIMLIADIINVLGNAICIYGLNMGISGVAIPTLLSRVLAGIVIIWFLTREKYLLHIKKSLKPHFDWILLKRVLNVGIPYGIENGLFQIGRLLVLSLVSTLGTAAIAANSIGYSLVTFTILPGFAINLGMTAVISRCVGAKDYNQARYYTKKILIIVYALHIMINIMITLILPSLLGLYNLSSYTTDLTYQLVIWHIIFAVTIWPIAFTLPGTFRGAGDAKYPMYISISVMFICRILLSYVFVSMGMGVFGTWLAMFVDWFVRGGLYLYRYFNNKWTLFNAIES